MTRDELIDRYVAKRTASVIYDAENSTSYEDEITGLVRRLAEHDFQGVPTESLQALVEELERGG